MSQATPSASFNLSRWAIEHSALTRYLMVDACAVLLGEERRIPIALE